MPKHITFRFILIFFIFLSSCKTDKENISNNDYYEETCGDPNKYYSCNSYLNCERCFQEEKLSTTTTNLPDNNIWDIEVDNSGSIWFALREYGVSVMDSDSNWNHYGQYQNNAKFTYVSDIEIDKNQSPWVASSSGLYNFKNETWNEVGNISPEFISIQDEKIWALSFDYNNNSYSPKIYTYDINSYKKEAQIEVNLNLETWQLGDICVDNLGAVYLATYSGLYFYQSGTWSNYAPNNSNLNSTEIYDLLNDGEKIWVAGNQGLYTIKNGSISTLKNYPVADHIYLNSKKDIWINSSKSCSFENINEYGEIIKSIYTTSCGHSIKQNPLNDVFYTTGDINSGVTFFKIPF